MQGQPFGTAVMHKFLLFAPAAVGEEHDGSSALPFQVEREPSSDPFLGAVDAAPLDLQAGY